MHSVPEAGDTSRARVSPTWAPGRSSPMPRRGLNPLQRNAGELSVMEGIERSELVGLHDQPEHDLVAALGTLMPQAPLRQKCAGPAAEQLQRVQGCG